VILKTQNNNNAYPVFVNPALEPIIFCGFEEKAAYANQHSRKLSEAAIHGAAHC
jgi:hypothetical protein